MSLISSLQQNTEYFFYVFAFCYVMLIHLKKQWNFYRLLFLILKVMFSCLNLINFFLDRNYTKEESAVRKYYHTKYFHTLWQNRSCGLFVKKLMDLGISTLVSCKHLGLKYLYTLLKTETCFFTRRDSLSCLTVACVALSHCLQRFQWFRW